MNHSKRFTNSGVNGWINQMAHIYAIIDKQKEFQSTVINTASFFYPTDISNNNNQTFPV